MKTIPLLFLIPAVLVIGCSRDRDTRQAPQSSAAVEADNSGRNVRDRNEGTKTAGRSVRERGGPDDHSEYKKGHYGGRLAFHQCEERQDYHQRWNSDPAGTR